ncbi:MAG: pseudouridine-5'-phosphate glycosidase [Thermoleophilia bacterium]|nr:pseudouridine-5'-phosphate glycosidase [Thermoleophilia bacterium]
MPPAPREWDAAAARATVAGGGRRRSPPTRPRRRRGRTTAVGRAGAARPWEHLTRARAAELPVSETVRVSEEVGAALTDGRPVVALETTLVAHGFPSGEGVAVAVESERRVRTAGGVPATIGVLDGQIRVGLAERELERFDASARKVGPRDLAAAAVQHAVGATTVGGTLAVCRSVGIRFLGTGGLGGVHRRFAARPDVSADLGELARTPVLVACSGVKSLLDVPATVELLEALGVPLLGWRTDTLPLFYRAQGGPPVPTRVETADEAASLARVHWDLGRAGVVLAQPPLDSVEDVEALIERALAAADAAGVTGGAVTPFVLAHLHRESGGRTLEVNRRLVVENAGLAAAVAVADADADRGR